MDFDGGYGGELEMKDSQDDGQMAEIRFIVESLNQPPYDLNLTLIEFDSKAPLELLQIVNDLFASLDPKHKKDLRDEEQDQMATRMLEFLMILNYKFNNVDVMNPQFREPFLSGDRRVVYPLLHWLLSNQQSLSKRAYLARFLRNVEVPEDNFADHQVVSLYQKYKELQEEFKTNHKKVDKLRKNAVDPQEIKRELQQLELERTQLRNKLQKLNTKVKHGNEYQDVDFGQVLAQTHALREQQEEEHRLMEQLDEQKRDLIRNQQRRHQAKMKLNQQQADMTNPKELMDALEKEVSKQRELLENRLPNQIQAQEGKLNELKGVMTSDPMTEDEVRQLEIDIRDMEDRIHHLKTERDKTLASQNSRIGHYQDQVNAREAKKEKLKDELEELLEDKREYEAEERSVQQEMAGYFTDDNRPKTEKEMQKYMLDLQTKTRQFKTMAEELKTLKREADTLSRTVDILRSRHPQIHEFDEEMRKSGALGAQETKEKLEKISSSKAEADTEKETTLAQVSELVKKIQRTLDEKKGTMGPQIKKLREVRRAHGEVQKQYEAKKSLHNNTFAGLQAERSKLEQDVQGNIKGLSQEESHYHMLHCKALETEGRLLMVQDESSFIKGEAKLSQGGCKTYQELLAKSIKQLETKAKGLRRDQKLIKSSHGDKLEQRKMFENLQKIMSLKHRLTVEEKRKLENEKHEGTNFMQIADDLTENALGERMIINAD
mmetsp:Transcript_22537/g.36233  ORF Transcript_22537/g.36233 Transcript_22537/m.36233 type:complete len:718 (+) Transcript_22537:61-2214(+)